MRQERVLMLLNPRKGCYHDQLVSGGRFYFAAVFQTIKFLDPNKNRLVYLNRLVCSLVCIRFYNFSLEGACCFVDGW